ncbi:hypothetical protein DUNSADRAFT_18000 [Dunaliella salina]|uniref:Uncharacterized protein n=1 Tax=Dunaliella salina TaxID=3046 RepID=A0ABQ7G0W3_DUNSA|nr:hypothetical protein DUNSADRAFT_18000 [Dunaliella salina]|eukprot:KAF5828232.1 hypothetical protein DUNSADRAFT_18000 [Dunaliella salina]
MQAPVLLCPSSSSRIPGPIQATSCRSSSQALHFRCIEQHNGLLHGRHTTQNNATSRSAPAAASTSAREPVVTTLHQSKSASKWGKGGTVLTKLQRSKRGKEGALGGGGKGDDDEEEKWGILDWSRFEGWDVPWGGATTAGGMALWFGSFVAVGFLVVPGIYGALGIKLSELPLQDKSQYVLVTQVPAFAPVFLTSS